MQDRSKQLLYRAFIDLIIMIIISFPIIIFALLQENMRTQVRTGVLFVVIIVEIFFIIPLSVHGRKLLGSFGFSFDFIERDTKLGGSIRENPRYRDSRIHCERVFFSLVLVFWFPIDMLLMIFLIFGVKGQEEVEIKQDGWEILKKAGIDDPDRSY